MIECKHHASYLGGSFVNRHDGHHTPIPTDEDYKRLLCILESKNKSTPVGGGGPVRISTRPDYTPSHNLTSMMTPSYGLPSTDHPPFQMMSSAPMAPSANGAILAAPAGDAAGTFCCNNADNSEAHTANTSCDDGDDVGRTDVEGVLVIDETLSFPTASRPYNTAAVNYEDDVEEQDDLINFLCTFVDNNNEVASPPPPPPQLPTLVEPPPRIVPGVAAVDQNTVTQEGDETSSTTQIFGFCPKIAPRQECPRPDSRLFRTMASPSVSDFCSTTPGALLLRQEEKAGNSPKHFPRPLARKSCQRAIVAAGLRSVSLTSLDPKEPQIPATPLAEPDVIFSSETKPAASSAGKFRIYQEEKWMTKYQELRNFIKRTGHTFVPHGVPAYHSLARWTKRQRYQFKLRQEGKESTMSNDRVALLDALGFVWNSHAACWEERLFELKQFKKERGGSCNVPSKFPENQKLATWVKCQRRQYKLWKSGRRSHMTLERSKVLEGLGFVWELRFQQSPLANKTATTAQIGDDGEDMVEEEV